MRSAQQTLDGRDFEAMLAAASEAIAKAAVHLSRLDAAGGDGDHGANMAAAMTRARASVADLADPLPGAVMESLARACSDNAGGVAGALFGALFAGVASAIGGRAEVDAATLAAALAAGLARVQRIGGAVIGQKTMVDALVPALSAATEAAGSGTGPTEVLERAAQAAHLSAEATSALVPEMGRARYAPDRALGTPDAGATTVAVVLEAWARAAAGRHTS